MARREPYWATYLPSWKEKAWKRPAEIHLIDKNKEDSSSFMLDELSHCAYCKKCSCTCSYTGHPERCPFK